MARPEVIKTQLGGRLREVRKQLGDPERTEFAAKLNVSANTLAHYERGDRVPDADVLAAYRDQYEVNLNWVATGDGPIFEGRVPFRPIHEETLRLVSQMLDQVWEQVGIKFPRERALTELTRRYNELWDMAGASADASEAASLLPWLENRVRKEIDAARAEPGTGKRLA